LEQKPEIFEAYAQPSTTHHLEPQKAMQMDNMLARDTSASEIIRSLESMAFRSFSSTQAAALLRLDLDPSDSRLTTSNEEKSQKLGHSTPDCTEFVVSEGDRGHSDIGLASVFTPGLDFLSL
jgi:hypothetical protein